jgi:predicted glycosyltransferase
VDIDNPPQVRFALPIVRRLEAAGHNVLVTARAYGDTFAILRDEGALFEAVGASFGKGVPRKLHGLAKRARLLTDFVGNQTVPVDFLLSGSRAAGLAARRLGIPGFVFLDYEHVDLLFYEVAGTYIMHPQVIGDSVFKRRGVRSSRLLPFDGLKEDISLSDIDVDAIPAHTFGDDTDSTTRILFRPPAEESHYFRRASRELALELLTHLSTVDAKVIFSPRTRDQAAYLDCVSSWCQEPILLREPIPFVSLLKGVDAVVSAGGTMLREAAYLGVPAYSIFRGRIGAVDQYLVSIGRLALLRSAADFTKITLARRPPLALMTSRSNGAVELVETILGVVQSVAGTAGQSPSPA